MAKPKKPAKQATDPVSLSERQRAAAEVLLTLGRTDAPSGPGADHPTPWGNVRSREELLANLAPLAPAGAPHSDDASAAPLTHSNPVPVSDRRGVFVETGNSGKSRVTRSGHKP